MEQVVIKLKDGGIIEAKDDEVKVISTSGICIRFDAKGNLISQEIERKKPIGLGYFFTMGRDERAEVVKWYSTVQAKTNRQKDFLDEVGKAIEKVDYNYKISTIEPSRDKDGYLYFEEGKLVAKQYSLEAWEELAEKFAPENESRMASIYELVLWYAYRIAKGYWTISYVCDDSSKKGNYIDSPDATKTIELTGNREVGGFNDGIGNTYKVVLAETGYAICGGSCYDSGEKYPVGNFLKEGFSAKMCHTGTAVLALKCDLTETK